MNSIGGNIKGFRSPRSIWNFRQMSALLNKGINWSAEDDNATAPYILINQPNNLCSLNIKPEYKPPRLGDIVGSVANINHAKTVLGYQPEYSFEEGLKITFDWYKGKK